MVDGSTVLQFGFLFLVPQFSEKHPRKWTSTKTNQQQFSMVCTLTDHRNYVEMLKTLQWNHSPVWLMVPLDEF